MILPKKNTSELILTLKRAQCNKRNIKLVLKTIYYISQIESNLNKEKKNKNYKKNKLILRLVMYVYVY